MIRRRTKEEHPDGGWRLDDTKWPRHAPAAGARTADTVEQLERLAALRDSGAITDEEFGRMKSELVPSPPPG